MRAPPMSALPNLRRNIAGNVPPDLIERKLFTRREPIHVRHIYCEAHFAGGEFAQAPGGNRRAVDSHPGGDA